MEFDIKKIDKQLLLKVSKLADIEDFINSLDKGFDTKINELGSSLSGGQKQRISLARAFYRRPKLIILDEPTSSLDSNTEKNIVSSISALPREITLVICAHRVSTLSNCDYIINIIDGKIKNTVDTTSFFKKDLK